MIAIPVKTQKEEGVVTPLFGKAKYFSIVDEKGVITTKETTVSGGIQVVNWLKSLGVTSVIVNHLGEKPFHELLKNNIAIYYAGKERITLNDALKKLEQKELEQVSIANYMTLLGDEEHHDGGCCGKEHDHGEHDHHGETCCEGKNHHEEHGEGTGTCCGKEHHHDENKNAKKCCGKHHH